MKVIYSGFDNLDVAYQGQISEGFLECLEQAQQRAISAREPALIEYGGKRLHVTESGARGGYAFRCDTGPLGATWFFKRPNASDPWGIRISAKSLMLATYGLQGARERIEDTLKALGCLLAVRPESIGRVDFAVDVLAPDFDLHPDNFVMHSRSTRADHREVEVVRSHGRSGRYTSVTVGKMPGRQVIVYDKRLEAFQKPEKKVWLEIWRRSIGERGLPPIDFSDPLTSTIWRIETRAGKSCLKDQHKVTTWEELTTAAPTIFEQALDRTRYCTPATDTNRSRWPEHALWALARSEVAALDLQSVGPLPEEMVSDACRRAQLEIIDQQLVGLAATRLALVSPLCMPTDPLLQAVQPVHQAFQRDRKKFSERVDRARDRYAHFD
ncbi:hypothetical protein [Thalassobaculum salexigens]|uniref:hypothetical protein n=1 Tax=Thalassobaculum salexigens TaxID=455360 RepID=UPI000490C10A|nr:hypothetical protein [Thalassobaculum salexigens]